MRNESFAHFFSNELRCILSTSLKHCIKHLCSGYHRANFLAFFGQPSVDRK